MRGLSSGTVLARRPTSIYPILMANRIDASAADNMVFTQGPLPLGRSFGLERETLRSHFSPMETAAHPRSLFKPRSLGMISVTLKSFASLRTGVVKTFR